MLNVLLFFEVLKINLHIKFLLVQFRKKGDFKLRIVFIVLALLITGCVDKHNVGFFGGDKIEQQALKYSSKKELYLKDKRYLLVATYLNPIKNIDIDREKDNFLLNVFLEPKSVETLKHDSIKELKSGDKIAKISPIHSKWSKYYIISKTKSDEKILHIKLDKAYKLNFIFTNIDD